METVTFDYEAAYQEIARHVREWPAGNMDERFRFGTAAIHILPEHGISTRETERLWQRWLEEIWILEPSGGTDPAQRTWEASDPLG